MVCYARRGTGVVVAVIAVLLLFGGGAAHFLDVTALAVSLSIVFGTALLAATGAIIATRAVQHRRARAGGCVGCHFRCQHAMTVPSSRLSLVRVIDRAAAAEPTLLPMPRVRIPEPRAAAADTAAPRWPDRPVSATVVMIRDH